MTHPIPLQYHPHKAVKKEEQGTFNIYHFKDGTKLTVRKMFEGKLFEKRRFEWLFGGWRRKNISQRVVRFKRGKFTVAAKDFVGQIPEHYLQVLRARTRFEMPVAWLEKPKQGKYGARRTLFITRFKKGFDPLLNWRGKRRFTNPAFVHRVFANAAYELGKMHGAGIAHAHPHDRNILVDKKGNVVIIDPKFLTKMTVKLRKNIDHGSERDVLLQEAEYLGSSHDLYVFANAMEHCAGEIKPDYEKIVAAYRKGLDQGKRRLEWLKRKGYLM